MALHSLRYILLIYLVKLKITCRKGNPSALLVGMQTGAATVETVWNFFKKLKMKLPFDPVIPLLGLYPKNPETPNQKNLCTTVFTAALFTIARCWKQPRCLAVNEWIKKLWYLYTMAYYSAERRNSYICYSMNRTGEYYAT